jgi:riboflavin synthase
MFSGIIKEIGTVAKLEIIGDKAQLYVQAPMFSPQAEETMHPGDSVAVSGVCLTVTQIQEGAARFDLASETRRVTTLGLLDVGAQINLERSLRFGERLDGHLVQGHVDAISRVESIKVEENTSRYVFSMSKQIAAFIVPKGSVSIDGVSLTVGEVAENNFSVYIIPYTMQETTFQNYKNGTLVNIETDCVARYISKLAAPYFERLATGV